MKKLSLIMALLLVFASVSAMAEDTTAESVFDYRVDFQTLSSYPEDGILSSNVYNYMSNGACYQKIGSSDGAGWGHSVAVDGMNSDITYAEAKVNAVWSAGFKIGFVPEISSLISNRYSCCEILSFRNTPPDETYISQLESFSAASAA